MILFLTSLATLSEYQDDIKIGSSLNNCNNFVENIKKYAKNASNFVYIANDPNDFEDNDISGKFVFEAFLKQNFPLENLCVIDNRTKHLAQQQLKNADIIFLRGGTLERQINFVKDAGIDKMLEKSNAIIIGQSAGAMILSKSVYQYPETIADFSLEKYITGVGLYNTMIIPHFNPVCGNELCDGSFIPLSDFFLPDSVGKQFLALENGSYILKDQTSCKVFGNAYTIADGKVEQICQTNSCANINI